LGHLFLASVLEQALPSGKVLTLAFDEVVVAQGERQFLTSNVVSKEFVTLGT